MGNIIGSRGSIVIDVSLITDNKLFDQLTYHPDESVSTIEEVILKEHLRNDRKPIRFNHYPGKVPVRDLNSSKISRFLSVSGIVRKVTDPKPVMTKAYFKCMNCKREHIEVTQDEKKIKYPSEACRCGKSKWQIVPDRSEIVDYQSVKVQESPEGLVGGESAATVDVDITGDQVGLLTAGNRVVVNGVYRAYQKKKESLILSTYIECSSLEVDSSDFCSLVISDEEETKIVEMSTDPYVFDKIVGSIAPSIFGYEHLKEAVALQLFGGVTKDLGDGSRKRGDMHILLVGDPGIAKSQLLKSVYNLCPRAVLTSGKGSSTAGLTAAAVKDAEGQWALEAGAVVLADQGQLLIDEVDKMREEDRSSLHQAMEQQEISISKAGINVTLNSRCSILAAANPKLGRFDDMVDLAEQVDLVPTLLSRFDLIFLMKDIPDAAKDRKIAEHIISNTPKISDYTILRKYIAYAKKNVIPKLDNASRCLIVDYYTDIRSKCSRTKPVPLTARQFESLVRLCEASARSRLSQVIELKDAEIAVRVLDSCLKGVAYDAKTGQLDIDKAYNKTSKATRDSLGLLKEIVREYESKSEGYAKMKDVSEALMNKGYSLDSSMDLIERCMRQGVLMEPRHGLLRLV